jgi:SAM-dependent methyltransferase
MRLKTVLNIVNPNYLFRHRFGTCPVCFHKTVFIAKDIPEFVRNHAICIRCKSAARHRAITLCILNEFSSKGINRLHDFRKFHELVVLNTSYGTPIADALGKAPNIFNTEYYDNCESGKFVNGVMCQNLEMLTFASNSIDLVISEDVFEHIVQIKKAFAEVYRVLKPGGVHVFSIPFYFADKTQYLFHYVNNEFVPAVLPIEYHGDGIRGKIPAYYHLGYDMFDWLSEIGFETSMHRSQYYEHSRYGTYDCYTFVSRKK